MHVKIPDFYEYPKPKGFRKFIWNPETKEFLGRTASSWAKITVFYIVLYTCLAALCSICFAVFTATLKNDKPKWILGDSLIGTNPGVTFQPSPEKKISSNSILIRYNLANPDDIHFWTDQLDILMQQIKNVPSYAPGVVNCSYGGSKASETQVCRIHFDELGPCRYEGYGFASGKPCVLIKLNKIIAWEPEPYGVKNGKYYEEILKNELLEQVKVHTMPKSLMEHVLKEVSNNPKKEISILKTVWISCEGEDTVDQQNVRITGYYPQQGIPGYYYPYYKLKWYRAPFVFLQLEPKKHHVINIECKVWAKNIIYDRENHRGSVRFEILVD